MSICVVWLIGKRRTDRFTVFNSGKRGTTVHTLVLSLVLEVRRKSQMSKGGKENKNVSRDNQK